MKNNLQSYLFMLSFIFIAGNLIAQTDCSPGTSQVDLDANNVKVRLPQGGSLWWDGNEGKYIFPKESNVSALFAGGIWLSGTDPAGNLKLSALTYDLAGGNGAYWPGPVDPNSLTVDAETCANWDIHFQASSEVIIAFRADFEDNGQLDDPIPAEIAGWPSRGNPLFFDQQGFELPNTDAGLAPFWDENGDALYNPNDGDYPLIKDATQAIWWVMNTIGNTNSTNSDPVSAEIQVMAYSYASSTPAINNTTFYDYKIINRAIESLEDAYFSLWVDGDLGCFTDDYVGCIPEKDMAFIYNMDAQDGEVGCNCPAGVNTYCDEIPVLGIKLLNGPLSARIIDDNGDLIIPPIGTIPDTIIELGMSSFMIYNNAAIGNPIPSMTGPNSPQEYYNYMQGLWRDGSQPMFNDEPTSYLYAGNPGDLQDGGWSMCSEKVPAGDPRILINSGPFRLEPGAINRLSFAVTGVENVVHPCPDITPLIDAMDEVTDFHGNPDITSTNKVEVASNKVKFSPNPMINEGQFVLEDLDDKIQSIKIFSINGKAIKSLENINDTQFTYTNHALVSGMYVYHVFTEKGKQYAGKFVK